jgi:hypothetical protein
MSSLAGRLGSSRPHGQEQWKEEREEIVLTVDVEAWIHVISMNVMTEEDGG